MANDANKTTPTRYYVFRQEENEGGAYYIQVGGVEAYSAPKAIELVVEQQQLEAGNYVAVAVRHFQIEPVGVTTQTVVTVGA